MLNREPMWLKFSREVAQSRRRYVSVLNREPMWLKSRRAIHDPYTALSFSAQP